jgi:mono/diheme cytochrome c family protein
MKRKRLLLRLGGLFVILAILLVGGALGLVWVIGPPTHDAYEPSAFALEAEGDPVAGKRVAKLLCARCHFDPESDTFAGRSLAKEFRDLGTVHAANLTHDEARGIGSWSDEQLVMLLRSGVHPQSKELLPPYMPFLPNIAGVDLANLVAFLRSDDPWVAAETKADPRSKPAYGTVLRAWVRRSPGRTSNALVLRPPESEPIALGAYLANDLLQCHGCHSASFADANWLRPAETKGFYEGGAKLRDPGGRTLVAPGLTPRDKGGLGGWKYDDFRKVLRSGVTPDGHVLRWPMPRYGELTEGEITALYAYFQTLPPAGSAPSRPEPYKVVTRIIDPGRHEFERLGCPSCHPPKDDGVQSLDAALDHYPDAASLTAFIADPSRVDADAWMPGYGDAVDDEQMAALVEYVQRRVMHGPYAAPPR